jgi:hypothetical protein
MRFGTFFFFQAAPGLTHEEVVHRELEQMEWTEELGFDQIWLTEHHFIDYGLAVDPATLATAAASRTRRVRIGLAAAILPFIIRCGWPSSSRSSTSSPRAGWTSASAGAIAPRSSAATTSPSRRIASVRRGGGHHAPRVDGGPLSRMTGGSSPSRTPASFPSRCSGRIR